MEGIAPTPRSRSRALTDSSLTVPDAAALASRAAAMVAGLAASSVGDHGKFRFAVSGGHTPWAMFAELKE